MGPSLEYNFVLFNQNDLSGKKLDEVAARQAWFRDLKFRQAESRDMWIGTPSCAWSMETEGRRCGGM